jgi:crotonobetainyl-CoA:carnitine CoA-transferase CaiB-like acyl-CoA transferase
MGAGGLAGLKVLDFTGVIAGPHCTRLMADLGAAVTKVEPPEGDMMRTRPPLRNGASTAFGQLNLGKRSVVLDLKRPEAVAAARRLAAGADVVIENSRPGVMARFGLDYPGLRAVRPDLVYASISGYGQTGPSAGLPAYAPVIHAASGFDLAHGAYQEGRARPDSCGVYIADVLAGTYAFGAIMAALYERQATGIGQFIDVSMLESMLTLTLTELQTAQFDVPPMGRPTFTPLPTRDGWIMPAVASERSFEGFCRTIGRPGWIADPRFARYIDRRRHWAELMDGAEEWTRGRGTEECRAAFDREGVPCSPYRTVKEAMADPQLAHRGALAEARDAAGPFKALNPPFRLSETRAAAGPAAPALGEHTREVLAELGYAAAEIARLTATGGAAAASG